MRVRERPGGIRQRVDGARQRLGGYRARVRSTPHGKLTLQVATAIVGSIVVIVGIILIPFPGPGWLIVLTGLAILAVEFVWAQRLLIYTRRHLERWWRWVLRQNLFVRAIVGLSGMAFVTGVVLLTLRFSFGITSITDLRDFFTN
jgi:uncharacterized protein (TIGR02611 family)